MLVLLKRCSKCMNVFPTKLKLSTRKTFAFVTIMLKGTYLNIAQANERCNVSG